MKTDQRVWGEIVAKAWEDEAFKRRLLVEPAAVVKEFGLEVPPAVQLRVVENTDRLLYLTLPAKPMDQELSDESLALVTGAGVTGPAVGRGLSDALYGDKTVRNDNTGNVGNQPKQPDQPFQPQQQPRPS